MASHSFRPLSLARATDAIEQGFGPDAGSRERPAESLHLYAAEIQSRARKSYGHPFPREAGSLIARGWALRVPAVRFGDVVGPALGLS